MKHINMNDQLLKTQAITRRHLLRTSSLGLGAMALNTLGGQTGMAASKRKAGQPHHAPKAKSVIYLHMAGAPSQLDMFDYKPALEKFDNKPCPQEYLEGKRFAFIKGVPKMLAPQFKFEQVGESGQWVSELMPNLKGVVDELAVIRSMYTKEFNHAPAQLFAHTGHPRLGYPSMGSWVTYGLGTVNQNLPGFVVLMSGGKTPSAGKSLWGSGFLPTVYQGVQCRTSGDPVLYLSNPKGMDRAMRRKSLDAIQDLNQWQLEKVGDPETLTRISQYELAFRMQVSVPEVMDLSKEPAHILDLYGAKPGHVSKAESANDPRKVHAGDDPAFANNCLLARRLVESGVRFVQLYDWGWDHHANAPRESIDEMLPIKCRQIDRAIAGLIKDLKQRGMLDSTLVVWGGEFGRTPMSQNNKKDNAARRKGFIGRDHHPFGYTMWMAGGGTKPTSYGATDEIGYYPVENKVGLHDLQATILHQLGLDPHQFSVPYQGLDQRLIGPTDDPRVIKEVLA